MTKAMTKDDFNNLKKYDKLTFTNTGEEVTFLGHVDGVERGRILHLGTDEDSEEKVSQYHWSHFHGKDSILRISDKNGVIMFKHKYSLGQRVKVVKTADQVDHVTGATISCGKSSDKYAGEYGIVIALTIQDAKYYANDYTIAFEDRPHAQYKSPKLMKLHINEENLIVTKTITAYCYMFEGDYMWTTSNQLIEKTGYKRVTELDMSREVEVKC